MAQGGARARSGPPPDPNALRRDRPSDIAGWTTLPAAGRVGDPPEWPLGVQSPREAHYWPYFWSKPQAVEWQRLGMVVEVAVYVRRLTEAEFPGSPVALGTLVKQLGEQLGLTIPGMKMHRWRIGGEPGATKTAEKDVAKPARSASRDRFTVVNGGAAS